MHTDHCLDLLDAYVDGELPSDERAAVRAHVAECVSCAGALESLAATSRILQENLVHYVAPDVLKARIRSALADAPASELDSSPALGPTPRSTSARPAPPSRWLRIAGGVAAAVVIAAASSATTLAVAHRDDSSRRLANEVLTSHIRSLMPGHLVDVASTNQHNVKPWFNGRVNLSPAVPGLDSAGFPLVGGRLDYLDGHATATVVYMRRQHVINIYSWPSADDARDAAPTTAESRSAQGYHLVSWRSGDIEYCAVSDLNAGELAAFVVLYRRMSGEPSR